jgi:AAA+ ATPase superfamily predicted ATPase
MTRFIGREHELARLKDLLRKKSSSLVVIRGRRRIGKSRLAEEFAKEFSTSYFFTALPPEEKITAEMQREKFAELMRQQKIPRVEGNSWGDMFKDVASACKKGRILVVIDEISWMGSKDPAFLGNIHIAWEQYFKKNPQLVLILSGSNSAWIEENILSSTGFVGRISLRLHLKELSLAECNRFWGSQRENISSYEKFKLLGITGGVPRYLEEIDPRLSAEENIQRMCFEKEGFLCSEFDDIFSDLFSHKSTRYKEIVHRLVDGPLDLKNITKALDRFPGGDISEYLDDLCESGFVSRDYTWDIKNGSISKLSQFRLSDNYVRFYLKYIEPNKQRIEEEVFKGLPLAWYTILGLQFENLVNSNKEQLWKILRISEGSVIASSPYFQTKTASRSGCQIDLLIETKFNTLYLVEIKFHKEPIGISVVEEVKEKMRRLKIPRGFSIRPVLIHVNGVQDSVIESEFFSNIIDFSQFLS